MKKIVFPVLFSCFVSLSFGQSLKKATSYFDANQLDKAKTEIDGVLAKKPDDAEAIYLKSKIYLKIAGDEKFKMLITGDAKAEALEAFKKAEADSLNMKAQLEIAKDAYKPVFEIYSGYYQDAAAEFNKAGENKDKGGYSKAMDLFLKAENVGKYINLNKWASLGDIDTTLVLNIAKAAINADNEKMAITYLSKLAEAKIAGVDGKVDENYLLPYQWLVLHYKNANDEANMVKYAKLGKEVFPKDDYVDFVKVDYYREKKNVPELLNVYKSLVANNPDSASFHFSYANDIFRYVYNSDDGTVIQDKPGLLNTLKSELETALKLNPEDVSSNWLYSQYYYNNGIETRDSSLKIKGTKPEDVKMKADLLAQSVVNFKASIPFATKALNLLEVGKLKTNKSNYKSIANLLQNIYQSLKDKDNLKVYQDKYDAADDAFVN